MLEGFFELLSIIVGRYILGRLGYYVRLAWSKLFIRKTSLKEAKSESFGLEEVIDVDDYKNRIVGLIFLSLILIIGVIVFN